MDTKHLFPQNTLETTIWNCPFSQLWKWREKLLKNLQETNLRNLPYRGSLWYQFQHIYLTKSKPTTTMLVSLYCYFPFTCHISSFFSFCTEASKKNGCVLIKHLWYRETRQTKRHINARKKPIVFCPHFHEMQIAHWGMQGFSPSEGRTTRVIFCGIPSLGIFRNSMAQEQKSKQNQLLHICQNASVLPKCIRVLKQPHRFVL